VDWLAVAEKQQMGRPMEQRGGSPRFTDSYCWYVAVVLSGRVQLRGVDVRGRFLLVAAKMRAKMAMSIDLADGWARFDS
jgi:hypothetical protein